MDKKKGKIIIAAGILLLIVVLLSVISFAQKKREQPAFLPINKDQQEILITAPGVEKSTDKLKIIKTTPADKAKNVPSDQTITVTFNRKISLNELEFSMAPEVKYVLSVKNNELVVTPEQSLNQGITYTYLIKQKDHKIPLATFSFTVQGNLLEFLPDTRPLGAQEFEENFQRENHPDVFLANKTPFETDLFAVTNRFVKEPEGHFKFTVYLLGETSVSQKAFYDWLGSLNLTSEQIAKLDIEFR